jgi:toxin ParE1/3/4
MPEGLISEQATEDLAAIWAYVATDNPVVANRTLDKMSDHCLSYAHQPELGEQRPNLGNRIRCFSVGLYVIYYRSTANGIEIVRVLHGARDVERRF